jgi:hypothetical protein
MTACGSGARSSLGRRNSHVANTNGAVRVGIPIGVRATSIAPCTTTVKMIPRTV